MWGWGGRSETCPLSFFRLLPYSPRPFVLIGCGLQPFRCSLGLQWRHVRSITASLVTQEHFMGVLMCHTCKAQLVVVSYLSILRTRRGWNLTRVGLHMFGPTLAWCLACLCFSSHTSNISGESVASTHGDTYLQHPGIEKLCFLLQFCPIVFRRICRFTKQMQGRSRAIHGQHKPHGIFAFFSRINEKSVWCCGWLPCTPLRIAATAGHGNCVEFLIQKGAEIDLVDVKGQTALYVAVVNGHLECAQILLEAGADPNGSRHHRSTPVYHAARVGRADLLRELIR